MCGIVGVCCFNKSGLIVADVDIFKQLLYVDSLRGMDGTGVMMVNRAGEVGYRKLLGTPIDLFRSELREGRKRSDPTESWIQSAATEDAVALIGHNRLASVGGRSTDNAHPFMRGGITLVHNGRIDNIDDLLRPFGKDVPKYEVDSDGLAIYLSRVDIIDGLSAVRGAIATVFWDEDTKTINLFRNRDRPLAYVKSDVSHMLYIASEAKMLTWLLDRSNRMPYNQTVKELDPYVLMSFDQQGGVKEHKIEEPLPIYVAAPWQGHNGRFEGVPPQAAVDGATTSTAADSTASTGGNKPPHLHKEEDEWVFVEGVWLSPHEQRILKSAGEQYPPKRVYPLPTTVSYVVPVNAPPKRHRDTDMELKLGDWVYVQQMGGFRKDDPIEFVPISCIRTSTNEQDQWRVEGMLLDDRFKNFRVIFFVKGATNAELWSRCRLVRGKCSTFKMPLNQSLHDKIIHITSPKIVEGPTVEDLELLNDSTTDREGMWNLIRQQAAEREAERIKKERPVILLPETTTKH